MRKTTPSKRRSKRKTPTAAAPTNPFAGAPLDEDLVALLAQMLQDQTDFPAFEEKGAAALFTEYLESRAQGEDPDEEECALIADLIGALDDLRIGSNGGNRHARETIRIIYDQLNSAIDGGSLAPVDLIMTGKILSDAGWIVPDRLKGAVADALQSTVTHGQHSAEDDIAALLTDIPQSIGTNPFDIHEYVNTLLAAIPPEASCHFLSALAAIREPAIQHALAGFMLHSEDLVAQAAADILRASAGKAPVESLLIERLVHMRPWLPPARQSHLDATLRALRPKALPPQAHELPKLVARYVSICDGSGTRSLSVGLRQGARYQFASVMMKPTGVADVVVIPELSKSAMNDLVSRLTSSMPTMKTDLPGLARMLRLALADNCAAATLPPFRLIELVESLGLSPLHPDHASAADLLAELLAGLPPGQTNPSAVAMAHADILHEELADQWFEAGEAVEEFLGPLKGHKRRVAALLKTYLPPRRPFWARQCAVSALAMRGDAASPWKQLALVGRDIASDLPLERIPLMQQIAEMSVGAFEAQL